MNDSRSTERLSSPPPGTGSQRPWYPPTADPAYADQAPYAPAYGGPYPPWAHLNEANTTKELPAYWQQDLPSSGGFPPQSPPPGGPKPPRWLWIAAGAAVLLVVALVIALILVNDAIKTQTAVPPLPPMPGPSSQMPPPPTRTSPSPMPVPLPPIFGPPTPTEVPGPATVQDVVYNVAGEGRAISIMYIDTGGLIQTEFNVALPWSKEVSLAKSALRPANVTVVNIGHNVTCSVTVDSVQVSHRVGVGLTICDTRG